MIFIITILMLGIVGEVNANSIDYEIRDLVLETETESLDQIMHNISKLGNKEMTPLLFLIPNNEFRKDAFKSLLFTTAVTQG